MATINSRVDLAPASKALAISALRSFLRWSYCLLGGLPFSLERGLHVLKLPKVHTITAPEILADHEIEPLAAAILDRTTMNAIRLDITGPSYRQQVAQERATKRGTKLPDDRPDPDAEPDRT